MPKTSRNIKDAHPYLRQKWPMIQAAYKQATGKDLFLTCTHRSVEDQQALYAQGRTKPGKIVTKVDGVTKRSQHNFYPSRAIDVCVDEDPDVLKVKVSWDWRSYLPLIEICKTLGLVSGGAWVTFKDWPHIELPKKIV